MKLHLYRLVFLFICCFCANTSKAQTYVGIQGGVSVSKTPIRLDDDLFTLNQKSKHSVLYALVIEHGLGKNIYLQSELQYFKEGSTLYKRDLDGTDFFYVINDIKYLKLPLLLKYKLKFADYLFYGLAGPSLSYALEGNSYFLMIDDRELNEQTVEKIDFTKSGISKFDSGIVFGAGLEKIIAKKVKLTLGFNYYYGFVNIGKQRGDTIFNESQSFFIGASIPLPEKNKKTSSKINQKTF